MLHMLRRRRRRGAASPLFSLSLVCMVMLSVSACDRAEPPSSPQPGLEPSASLFGSTDVGGPLPDLTADQLALFERGSIAFAVEFTPETGLGPLFNAAGCGNCHESPVLGGGGEAEEEEEGEAGEDIEVHATAFSGGTCDLLTEEGGFVFQKQATDALTAALGIDQEEPSARATAVAERTTSDLFGFGLLDAVPDFVIRSFADPFDANGDGISGRVHRTADGRIGRFGRKAQVPRLSEFNDEAFLVEMGITNPSFPLEQFPGGAPGTPFPLDVDPTTEPEVSQADLDATNGFVRFLAPPRPLPLDAVGAKGFLIFLGIGCAKCHVPALPTGASDVAALRYKLVYAYTDLLLHNMGPGLADICVGNARPSEFRTEPLMGLRFATRFLHDGRATTVEEAILAHGGEAQRARDRFAALPDFYRNALLTFLGSL